MTRRLIGLSTADLAGLPGPCVGCQYWETEERLPVACCARGDRDAAAAWIRGVAETWGECGRTAVEEGDVLGFIKYAPPVYFPQARHMPAGPPDPDTVLIACLHIAPEARRRGLGGVLLRAALRDLVQRGERCVQAYGTTQRGDMEAVPMVGVEFLLRHGFTVSKPHPEMPLLQLDLKSLVSWTENLEAVLESLRIPIGVAKHAPATYFGDEGQR